MRKIIIIPAQISQGEEEDGITSCCRQSYVDSILMAGGLPIILPLGLDKREIKQAFDLADGILLSGGSDVDPTLYNEIPHPKLGRTIKHRDQLESQLVQLAFECDKPILGICRGLQIMNVALGGSLYQDLPDQYRKQKTEIQHSQNGADRWEKLSHQIKIETDSNLSLIYQNDLINVNSLHHQGIKELSQKLNACAWAEDGLIEAIEAKNKKFFHAVQWHPEALWQNVDSASANLFESFISAC